MLLHGSVLEWIQMLLAAGCMAKHAALLRLAHRDCCSKHAHAPRLAQWLQTRLRDERFATFVAAVLFVVGVVIVCKAPPPGVLSDQAAWKLYALIVISITMLRWSVLRRRDRDMWGVL